MRIGFGFDTHHFAPNIPLVLGGVTVPHHAGLQSHSDGDVVVHALCDALLGALALGDIGQHFPDNDPRYKNISSLRLLHHVMQSVTQLSYAIQNVDITIIAEQPKLAPHTLLMRETLTAELGINLDQLSIKASTSDKLGFTGRSEGMVAYAMVLLDKF